LSAGVIGCSKRTTEVGVSEDRPGPCGRSETGASCRCRANGRVRRQSSQCAFPRRGSIMGAQGRDGNWVRGPPCHTRRGTSVDSPRRGSRSIGEEFLAAVIRRGRIEPYQSRSMSQKPPGLWTLGTRTSDEEETVAVPPTPRFVLWRPGLFVLSSPASPQQVGWCRLLRPLTLWHRPIESPACRRPSGITDKARPSRFGGRAVFCCAGG
jgi:hypothetical protein